MRHADALYYDGHSARAHAVTLTIEGGSLSIRGDGVARTTPLDTVKVTSRLARIRRVLQLPGGGQVHCDDNDAIDALMSSPRRDGIVDRLERHPSAIAASLIVTVLAFVWFFALGLPQLADRIAQKTPRAAEAAIGAQTLDTLDRTLFEPSAVDPARQRALTQMFEHFIADLPDADRYRLEFRTLPGDEANAFALPDGTIVVSDALIASIGDDNAFLAVVAHELGHHSQRHLLRSVLQGSAIIVLVALFTGDVSSATGVVLAVPTFLLSSHYSREFERDADAYAFTVLREHDVSPEWFAYAISSIADGAPATVAANSVPSYLSSHPASSERVVAARAAAQGFEALEVLVARSTARVASDGAIFAVAAIEGCWSGSQDLGGNRQSRWRVALSGDGHLRAQFRVIDETGAVLTTATNTGRWALQNEIMTVRMLSSDPGTGAVTQIDRLQNYHINAVTDDEFEYESMQYDEHFASRRIDCALFDD